ncbi:MAG: hypothetical protein ACP5QK_08445 [Myxococcota bacterium]
MQNTDLTFITNEPGQTLKERFEVLIKDSCLFDCLVGYFYTSGFYAIYKSLGKTQKMRVLIGIATSRETYDSIKTAENEDRHTQLSHTEAKEVFENLVEKEEDLQRNNIKFPEVEDPKPLYYQLNEEEDKIFMETIRLIAQEFTYARYTPLLYLNEILTSKL